jgi:hypothetical protein
MHELQQDLHILLNILLPNGMNVNEYQKKAQNWMAIASMMASLCGPPSGSKKAAHSVPAMDKKNMMVASSLVSFVIFFHWLLHPDKKAVLS